MLFNSYLFLFFMFFYLYCFNYEKKRLESILKFFIFIFNVKIMLVILGCLNVSSLSINYRNSNLF